MLLVSTLHCGPKCALLPPHRVGLLSTYWGHCICMACTYSRQTLFLEVHSYWKSTISEAISCH